MHELNELFRPGRIGTLEIRNRIVMNAMGTLLEDKDGSVSDRLIGYYEARAKGGAGLIVTCHTRVVPHPRTARGEGWMGIAIWDDKFLPGWRELANRVCAGITLPFLKKQTGSGGNLPYRLLPLSDKTMPRPFTGCPGRWRKSGSRLRWVRK